MGQDISEVESYVLVRRSDGAVVDTFTMGVGYRILLRRNISGIGRKHLQKDERIVSSETLEEMVREMCSRI